MHFRTLLIATVMFGIFSGTFAQWSLPLFLAAAPDAEIETSQGSLKCRQMRTFFDSKDAPPSCTSVAVKEIRKAKDALREEHDRAIDEAMSDPTVREYMEMRERSREEREDDSIEAEPVE